MAQFSPEINQFIEVLESYEYLLHAETQAIAAKEIDLIDSLNDKKDVCIAKLKLLNDQFTSNPRSEPIVDSLVEKIFDLQKRNFSAFSLLVEDQRIKRNKQGATSDFSPNAHKVAQAYKKEYKSRFKNLWE
ncbi:MAG: hypothetical protein VX609_03910 [Verrucomicrobiota bacterium]|nr:hypothetical protein [Verrucomicrobiota bacterium]